MVKKELIISPEGKMFRRTIDERELAIDDALVARLSQGLMVKTRNVAHVKGWGPVHFTAKPNEDIWWTIDLEEIHLKTHYQTENGVATPVFVAQSNEHPLFPLIWKKPNDMTLKMLVCTHYYPPPGNNITAMIVSFLFALDKEKRCYRLPLCNVFNNAKLCLGNEGITGATSLEVLEKTLNQFAHSQWNADLQNEHSPEHTKKVFRFKPTDTGFETLPPDGDWKLFSKKIAPPELENVC